MDNGRDHYSLSFKRRVHLSNRPLASAVFAQPANFNSIIKDGYRTLEDGHICAKEVKEKNDELYLSNANYGVVSRHHSGTTATGSANSVGTI